MSFGRFSGYGEIRSRSSRLLPPVAPLDYAMRGDESFVVSNLTTDGQAWHARLFSGIENPSKEPDTDAQTAGGNLYDYARPVNQVVGSLLMAFRVTGDLDLLDMVDYWMERMKGALTLTWDGGVTPDDNTDGLLRWNWLQDVGYTYYGTDDHAMDTMQTHALVAAVAWAFENNRDLTSPGDYTNGNPGSPAGSSATRYGTRADYWLDYLQNHYEAIWRIRIQDTDADGHTGTSDGWGWDNSPDGPPLIRRNLTHPFLTGGIRYAWYMYKLTGDSRYTTEIDWHMTRRMDEMLAVSTASGDAWVWSHGMFHSGFGSVSRAQGTVYLGLEALGLAEMTLEEAHVDFANYDHLQRMANSLSYFVDDGDSGATGKRFASAITGDTDRSGTWVIDDVAGSVNWYGDLTWRDRETELRWGERTTGLAGAWDSTGRVNTINDEVYASIEGDPANPTRLLIPAIKLFHSESADLRGAGSFVTDPLPANSFYSGQISNTLGARGFGSVFPNPARDPNATTVFVTNLNESGPGSLQEAMQSANAANPKVIIPLVSGVIEHATTAGAILVRDTNNGTNPGYLWFAGQAGPGKLAIHEVNGIDSVPLTIRESSNVIIENLTIRTREMTSGSTGGKDPLTLFDPTNVMINRCSFSWGVDGTVDVWGSNTSNITLQDSLIMEPLEIAGHVETDHDRNLLIAPRPQNISVHRCGLGNADVRHPEGRMRQLDFVNNMIINGGINSQISTDSGASSASESPECNFIGCVYTWTGVRDDRHPIRVGDMTANGWEPHLYIDDVLQVGGVRDGLKDWDLVRYNLGDRSTVERAICDYPPPSTIYTTAQLTGSEFGVGFNPGNNKGGFDSIDQRHHNDLKGLNTTPRFDTVAEAGGFPTIAQTTQTEANWRASFDTWKSDKNALSSLDLTTAADNAIIPETGRAVIEQYIIESF